MVKQLNLYEAKTQLSKLVEAAAKGEEIIIAKNGVPLAKLGPVANKVARAKPRPFGILRGKVRVPTEEEWAAMDREIAEMFEESANRPIEPE